MNKKKTFLKRNKEDTLTVKLSRIKPWHLLPKNRQILEDNTGDLIPKKTLSMFNKIDKSKLLPKKTKETKTLRDFADTKLLWKESQLLLGSIT